MSKECLSFHNKMKENLKGKTKEEARAFKNEIDMKICSKYLKNDFNAKRNSCAHNQNMMGNFEGCKNNLKGCNKGFECPKIGKNCQKMDQNYSCKKHNDCYKKDFNDCPKKQRKCGC